MSENEDILRDMINGYDIDKRSRATGIIGGIMINANFLCSFVSNYITVNDLFVYVLVFSGFAAIAVNGFKVPVKKKHMIILLIVIIQVLYGILFVNSAMSQRFFLCMIGVGIPSLLLVLYRIDIDVLIKTTLISSVVGIPYYILLFRTTFTVYNSGFQMGVAYSILPGIIAGIIVLGNKKNSNAIRMISILIIALGIVVLFKLQTRGAYLCLFIFGIGYIYIRYQKKASKKFLLCLSMIFVFGIIWLLFGDQLLASSWFERVFGKKQSNFLNGRDLDYEYAFTWRGLRCFINGSGVGSFQKYVHLEYIHNIIGQVYYEQGFFSAVYVLMIVFSAIKLIIKKSFERLSIKVFLLMFLCVGIIRLMLSYYFWIDQFFWIFFWLVIDQNYKIVLKGNLCLESE